MRKTWLFSILVIALMATGVAPAYAYSQQHRRKGYQLVWHFGQHYRVPYPIWHPIQPVNPQPTIPQLPAPPISNDPGTSAHDLTADENYILQKPMWSGLMPVFSHYKSITGWFKRRGQNLKI